MKTKSLRKIDQLNFVDFIESYYNPNKNNLSSKVVLCIKLNLIFEIDDFVFVFWENTDSLLRETTRNIWTLQ